MRGRSDRVRDIVHATLYAGYLRRAAGPDARDAGGSGAEGAIVPQTQVAGGRSEDGVLLRAEVPVVSPAPGTGMVEVTLRWLHVIERRRVRAGLDGLEFVRGAARRREAIERQVALPHIPLHGGARVFKRIDVRRGSATEWLEHGGHRHVGRVRSWRRQLGGLEATVSAAGEGVYRLRIEVRDDAVTAGLERQATDLAGFHAAHLELFARGAAFGSIADPPPAWADVASSCRNVGCHPVLVGDPGERHTLLVSALELPDYPTVDVAPEQRPAGAIARVRSDANVPGPIAARPLP